MSVTTAEKTRESRPLTVIEPPRGISSLGLGELWEYKDLLLFLAWRDFKVRYKQAAVGVAWAVIQPLAMMALFALFFGRLAKVPSDGLPYPVFAFAGLLPWTFFSNAVSSGSQSLVSSANLISKVYFPRLVIPAASLLAWLPDLAISTVVLMGLMAIYGVAPAWTVVLLPAFVLLAILAAASITVWLSALNVAYRDVPYAIPFLLQLWLFATPVVYPARLVPDQWQWAYGLNPMAGVVEGFRWALTGKADPPNTLMLVSFAVVVVLLLGGLAYFRKTERYFADLI